MRAILEGMYFRYHPSQVYSVTPPEQLNNVDRLFLTYLIVGAVVQTFSGFEKNGAVQSLSGSEAILSSSFEYDKLTDDEVILDTAWCWSNVLLSYERKPSRLQYPVHFWITISGAPAKYISVTPVALRE